MGNDNSTPRKKSMSISFEDVLGSKFRTVQRILHKLRTEVPAAVRFRASTAVSQRVGTIVRVPASHFDVNVLSVVNAGGDRIITGDEYGSLRLYDINSGDIVAQWSEHEDGINCLDAHNGYFLSGSADRTVKLWKLNENVTESIATFSSPRSSATRGLSFLNDGKSFIAGGHVGDLIHWDLETNAVISTAPHPQPSANPWAQHRVTHLRPSPVNSSVFITTGADGALRFWDVRTMSTVVECRNADSAVPLRHADFDAGGVHLLTTEADLSNGDNCGGVQLWDLRQLQLLRRFRFHSPHAATAALFVPTLRSTSDNFVSIGADNRLCFADTHDWNHTDKGIVGRKAMSSVELFSTSAGMHVRPGFARAATLCSDNRIAVVGDDGLLAAAEVINNSRVQHPRLRLRFVESVKHDEVNRLWEQKLECLGFR